jgi:hypothetical protein
MDRARVAMQLGDNSTALVLGHEAFECSTDPFDRDRLLLNIGLTLSHMGLWSEARDAYLVAAATGQESTVRWMAQINLMELAYLDGNELQFEHYQRAVPAVALPPYVETVYYETRAHGLCVFGRLEQATDACHRMLHVASRHGLNEFVIKADSALRDVSRVTPPLARGPRDDVHRLPLREDASDRGFRNQEWHRQTHRQERHSARERRCANERIAAPAGDDQGEQRGHGCARQHDRRSYDRGRCHCPRNRLTHHRPHFRRTGRAANRGTGR